MATIDGIKVPFDDEVPWTDSDPIGTAARYFQTHPLPGEEPKPVAEPIATPLDTPTTWKDRLMRKAAKT